MRLAIMQPYFLPYLGYWQLIASVDAFVILDSVNYIKGGWINRNRVAIAGMSNWITLPLSGASPNRLIGDIDIKPDDGWSKRLVRTIAMGYAKAPYGSETVRWFTAELEKASGKLSKYLANSILSLSREFGLTTEIIPTSRSLDHGGRQGVQRVLQICRDLGATVYVNAPGGKELYSRELFESQGIALEFLEPRLEGSGLEPGCVGGHSLSILHLMMFNSLDQIAVALHSAGMTNPCGVSDRRVGGGDAGGER